MHMFCLHHASINQFKHTVKTLKSKKQYLPNYSTLSSILYHSYYSAYCRVTYQHYNSLIRAIHHNLWLLIIWISPSFTLHVSSKHFGEATKAKVTHAHAPISLNKAQCMAENVEYGPSLSIWKNVLLLIVIIVIIYFISLINHHVFLRPEKLKQCLLHM